MLCLGCVAGVLVGAATPSAQEIDPARFALAATLLLVPALAGARLWFVLVNWQVVRDRPGIVWHRSGGGSALYGGLLVAVAASAALLPLAEIPFWEFWDAAAVTMLVGLILTRFGCLMNGCCAGRATGGRLGIWLPDHRGVRQRRIPTPLLEAAWAALLLPLALAGNGRLPFAGALFLGVAGAYAGARLLLEHTREPAAGRRANIAASGALVAGAPLAVLIGWPT
jgi:prolipoprotein diacylglyceryltransferase